MNRNGTLAKPGLIVSPVTAGVFLRRTVVPAVLRAVRIAARAAEADLFHFGEVRLAGRGFAVVGVRRVEVHEGREVLGGRVLRGLVRRFGCGRLDQRFFGCLLYTSDAADE